VTRELSRTSLAAAAEATVAALAIAGDDACYAELVRRRQPQIRGMLRRLCRNPALADDLAQQTFLQAWRKIRTLQSPQAFGGWLRRIAVSVWLQHLRVQPEHSARAAPGQQATGAHAPSHHPMIGERLDLERALAQLAPEARLCVVLAYDQGMSHPQIAEVTGLALGTVKSHVVRGAGRLRELLRDYE